jgi:hypothetical protein
LRKRATRPIRKPMIKVPMIPMGNILGFFPAARNFY